MKKQFSIEKRVKSRLIIPSGINPKMLFVFNGKQTTVEALLSIKNKSYEKIKDLA